eukprot:TRINITY_DN6431_c0_g1_i2.p1 TRINITY_DN6431_c0_g1~~TRINITY_DN6431_c0_g1_i2.p1  ORF type:complete len:102 (+),score=36.22 TRINITY_DN6431_c0_g1_i2:110-415(+)
MASASLQLGHSYLTINKRKYPAEQKAEQRAKLWFEQLQLPPDAVVQVDGETMRISQMLDQVLWPKLKRTLSHFYNDAYAEYDLVIDYNEANDDLRIRRVFQ